MTASLEPRTQGEEDEYMESVEEEERNRAHSLPTLGELRAAIPSQCFRPSAVHSMCYLLRDLAIIYALYALTTHLSALCVTSLQDSPVLHVLALSLLFPAYWYAQVWLTLALQLSGTL
jgi:Domain of unknown function (DUF3474)